MTITTDSTTASQSNPPPTPSPKKDSAATAASDFKSFLKLLTAQLRNQDPLSPLDSTQFVEQLASFSSVEQQIETNTLLKELTASIGQSGLENATQWIGKEVVTPVSSVHYAGEPLSFSLPPGASGEVVIRNSSKDVIFRQEIEAGQTSFVWNGQKTDGTTAPIADYKIQVEKKSDTGKTETMPVSTVAKVVEARLVEGSVYLILESGVLVDPSWVTAVRTPSAEEAGA